MAPRKKKPAAVRQAAKPPVINLKATEVKSATEKAEEARKKTQEKARVQSGPDTSGKQSNDGKSADTNKVSTAAKPEGPSGKKPVTGGKAKPEAAKKKNKRTSLVLVSLAALLAAGLGGAWAFKTYGTQFFADPNAVRAEQLAGVVARVAKLEAAIAEGNNNNDFLASLKNQLSASRTALEANQKTIQANANKLAELEKTASEVRVALAKAVENGKGPVAVANEMQFKVLADKIAGLEETPTGASRQELESLKTRFDAMLVRLNAVEQQNTAMGKSIAIVKSAQDRLASVVASAPTSNPASQLAREFTILRAKISSGDPYETELDQVAGLMPQETELDVLRPFAGSGIASLAALTNRLQEAEIGGGVAAPEISENADKGVFGALTSRLTGLVKITRAGQSDWSALKDKALVMMASGQVESAAKILRDGADAPAAITKWLFQADEKIKVDQAVKSLSGKIVARLTAASQ